MVKEAWELRPAEGAADSQLPSFLALISGSLWFLCSSQLSLFNRSVLITCVPDAMLETGTALKNTILYYLLIGEADSKQAKRIVCEMGEL